MADLLVLPRPAKSVQSGAGFSGKTGTYWACRKRKSGLSATESSWQERRSRPCQKEKEQSRQSREPDHEGGESQDGREPHLGEREENQSREHGVERVDSTVNEGQIPRRTGRASNKSLPRTSRRKHERVSGRKSSPGRFAESWFHSKSGQT